MDRSLSVAADATAGPDPARSPADPERPRRANKRPRSSARRLRHERPTPHDRKRPALGASSCDWPDSTGQASKLIFPSQFLLLLLIEDQARNAPQSTVCETARA